MTLPKLALIQPKNQCQLPIPYRVMPLSLGILATLAKNKFNVEVIDMNYQKISNYSKFDLVGITCNSTNYKSAYKLAEIFRKREVTVVLGGFHPSNMFQEAIKHCDSVVIGEAEEVWPILLQDFLNGRLKRKYVGKHVSMDMIPIVDRKYRGKQSFFNYMTFPVLTTRGCPHNCSFCSLKGMYGNKIRHRDIGEVVKEIRISNVKRLTFIDENIVANHEYAAKLFKALIPLKIRWDGQASLDIANNEGLVTLAVKSGCSTLMVGIESINEASLYNMTNKVNLTKVKRQIKILQKWSIILYASFIYGFDHDGPNIFERTINFAKQNKLDFVDFTSLTVFPGTKIYYQAKMEKRKIINDLLVPKNMNFEDLKEGVVYSYREFYKLKELLRRTWWFTKKRWYRPFSIFKFLSLSLMYHLKFYKVMK
jgi:radical SAM superfamily enzyme YgiQ (UPF0313 family)